MPNWRYLAKHVKLQEEWECEVCGQKIKIDRECYASTCKDARIELGEPLTPHQGDVIKVEHRRVLFPYMGEPIMLDDSIDLTLHKSWDFK